MMEIQDLKKVFEVLSLTGTTFDQAYALFIKNYEGDPFKVTLCIFRLLQNKVIIFQRFFKGLKKI
jgi:hypothetical protein